jgi:hypothetical protein
MQVNSVYRQFTDQIAADAASAAALPQPHPFEWLAGHWRWHGQTIQLAVTPYGLSRDRQPFLIYNPTSSMWLLVLADPGAFGLLISLGPRAAEIRFTGEITIGHAAVVLRQTWRRLSAGEVEITTERQRQSRWQLWERARLEQISPSY